jgi:hypothetical protein
MAEQTTNDGLNVVPEKIDEEIISNERLKFLEDVYLNKEYILPSEVDLTARAIATQAKTLFPGKFVAFTLVGGLSTGSYLLRRAEDPSCSTDVDFFLIGKSADQTDVDQMSQFISTEFQKMGLPTDPVLNGRQMAAASGRSYFDLLDISGQMTEDPDFSLLALPFQCSFGDFGDAQQAVINYVLSSPNPSELWKQISGYHDDSLLMQHKSWGNEFNSIIKSQYFPQKTNTFKLPPVDTLKAI